MPGWGGALAFEVAYHPLKKKSHNWGCFQDQIMYAHTSFRGAKTSKIQKKDFFFVFGRSDKFWEGHDGQIEKNAYKNAYLGSIFIPEKYVFRVCFESSFARMISSLKYKCSQGYMVVWSCAEKLFSLYIIVSISPLVLVCNNPSRLIQYLYQGKMYN